MPRSRRPTRRIEKLEPYLEGARQVSDIAILAAEYFHPAGARNNVSDDGAAQMLQELKLPLRRHRSERRSSRTTGSSILPDEIPVDAELAAAARRGTSRRAASCIFTGTSASNADGSFAGRCRHRAQRRAGRLQPVLHPAPATTSMPRMTETPFVMYGTGADHRRRGRRGARRGRAAPISTAPTRTFSSHQHAPDDPKAAPLGAAVTLHGGVGYIAYPIFTMYHAMGQPLYKYVVRGLIDRLLPDPAIVTDLPSSARATLTRQDEQKRHILHLLYGAPQVRGKAVPTGDGGYRVMEMIEDIPTLGPVTAQRAAARARRRASMTR